MIGDSLSAVYPSTGEFVNVWFSSCQYIYLNYGVYLYLVDIQPLSNRGESISV